VVEQGLHPHPGPTIYDCGFDDSDGGEWAEDVRDGSEEDEPDQDEWHEEPSPGDLDEPQINSTTIEDMAWHVLMQPPIADTGLRDCLHRMGCSYNLHDMRPNPMHQVWHDPGGDDEGKCMLAAVHGSSDDNL